MKANKQIIAKTFASSLLQDNSIINAIKNLSIYELITLKQADHMIEKIRKDNNVNYIFRYLKFEETFIEYTSFFNNYYSLSESINFSIDLINKKETLKKEVISSLIYPVLLIILTSVALLFISAYIVPQLLLLSPESQNDYRLIVVILKYVPLINFIFVILCVIGYLIIKITMKYSFSFFMRHIFKLPFINKTFLIMISLNFALYLKEVIRNVPLTKDSLVVLLRQSNNVFIKYLCNNIINELNNGEHLLSIIKQSKLLCNDLKHTMYLAINSKNMSILLEDYYLIKTNIITKKIKTIIAIFIPIVISFIGLTLILMYMLIMMPILNMGSEF